MHPPRVWLITGASSGFGKALTEVVLSKGDIVVATLRKPDMLSSLASRYPPSQLLVLKLDVSVQADVDHAFAQIKDTFGRLHVVFNNAGYAILGEIEATPDEDARALFDVNFWGTVRVSRAAVRFFREVNEPGRGGVILQNSSASGYSRPPGMAFYCASFDIAIDGFSECLAKELPREWNIKICIIAPGAFDTNAVGATRIVPVHPVYTDSLTSVLRDTLDGMTFNGDPYKFAETLHRMVVGGEIPLFLPMGEDSLEMLAARVKKMGKVVSQAACWSADLQKENDRLSKL